MSQPAFREVGFIDFQTVFISWITRAKQRRQGFDVSPSSGERKERRRGEGQGHGEPLKKQRGGSSMCDVGASKFALLRDCRAVPVSVIISLSNRLVMTPGCRCWVLLLGDLMMNEMQRG